MKVEVIKCVGHSIELIHGETSVCITPDEAENLIAQLRAVVPVPEDVKEATNQYIGYPPEVDEGVSTSHRRQAFADGMLAERKRLMKEAVECNVIWYDGRLLDLTQEQLDAALDKIGAGVDAKVSVIIIKKEK